MQGAPGRDIGLEPPEHVASAEEVNSALVAVKGRSDGKCRQAFAVCIQKIEVL